MGYWFDERLNCQIYPDPFYQAAKPIEIPKYEEYTDEEPDVIKQTEQGLNYIPGRRKPKSFVFDSYHYYKKEWLKKISI